MWGALLQAGGAGMQYEANARQQWDMQDMAQRQAGLESQMAEWEAGRQAADTQFYQQQALENDNVYRMLADELNKSGAARDAGVRDARSRIDALLASSGIQPAQNNYVEAARARRQPVLDALINANATARGYQAQQQAEAGALDRSGERLIDINRRGQERQRESSLLAAIRGRMVAQGQRDNRFRGPDSGTQAWALGGQMLGAAAPAVDYYSAARGGSAAPTGAGPDTRSETQGQYQAGRGEYSYTPPPAPSMVGVTPGYTGTNPYASSDAYGASSWRR